jgi:hypothetical protein
MTSSSRIQAESSKLSASDSSVESARTTWQQAQNLAVEAENNYRNLIAAGPREGESVQEYNERRTTAYNEYQSKTKRAKDAETNYQNVRASYDRSGSKGRSGSVVHRARKKIAAETGANANKATSDAISAGASSQVVNEATIEVRRSERTSNTNNS